MRSCYGFQSALRIRGLFDPHRGGHTPSPAKFQSALRIRGLFEYPLQNRWAEGDGVAKVW